MGLPWAGVSCEVDWSGPTIGKDVSFVSLYTVCVKLMLIKYLAGNKTGLS